jgi:ribose 5-phosphate isomerase B
VRVYLATDHGGFAFKNAVATKVAALGHEAIDCGAFTLDPLDDYPDFIIPMAERVAGEPGALGIVFGRSGNGEQIAANKVRGIRAALCLSTTMAQKAREHNNANVLALGGDYIEEALALEIVEVFLATPFSGAETHTRRIAKVSEYEEQHRR